MPLRCVNCSLNVARIRRHRLSEESEELFEYIRRWNYPQDISRNHYICHSCWELVNHSLNEEQSPPQVQVGHRNVCIGCGRSILRIRKRLVMQADNSERHQSVVAVLSEWIKPRQITPTAEVCIPCWLKAQRVVDRRVQTTETSQPVVQCIEQEISSANVHEVSLQVQMMEPTQEPMEALIEELVQEPADDFVQEPEPSTSGTGQHVELQRETERVETTRQDYIRLPSIRRAANTGVHCIFLDCNNYERCLVPTTIRRRVIKDFNFYIPTNARICIYHLQSNLYHELYVAENSMSTFNSTQIEEMVYLLSEEIVNIDFSHPETIDENLFHYWFGFTHSQYQEINRECPRFNDPKMKSGLNALLCKMRTGDSDERIANLFQVPRRTLEGYMNDARDILLQDFVPHHLGFNHITRDEIVSRNTILAEHLFGEPEAAIDQRPLIVIADGTYLNTQKSANYSFQKDSYSLHKYHNLLKPFLFVCCDGYIIEALGPYAATKNDATIMSDLLEEGGPFMELFKEDDIFILDRGFRDCKDELNDKGYQVHMPESISEGERQLTMLQANITRCVTMNRWVVEGVNGRFKRDFKVFREDYFNKRVPHMMQDFSIAAALLNCFAVQYSERRNVHEILNIIQEKIFEDNVLGDIVQRNNLNMRHTAFHTITSSNIQFPQLNEDDMQLISLGTYQIRQARSYVGEHMRAHGLYMIEVCRDESQISAFNGVDPYLLRAKIKSRHVGSKQYFVYIVVDRGVEGHRAILSHYCNCAAGKRTVGCCSHIMSIIWYMGYAKHQSDLAAPASFLENVIAL